jgi:Phosphate-selective porin O and P
MLNARDDSKDEDRAAGFVLRRAKIKVKGGVPFGESDEFKYAVGFAFSRKTGDGVLEDATIQTKIGDKFQLKLGQFRPNLLREESVSSKRQLAVERSLIAKAFNQERVRGVTLQHETERTRVAVALMDASTSLADGDAWVYTARGEVLVLGDWKQVKDYTSFPDDDAALLLGASVGFFDTDPGANGTPAGTTLRWSVDVSGEMGGANVFAAVVGNRFDPDAGPVLNQFGLVAQGGVFARDTTELFTRFEFGDADDGETLSLLTVGANEYLVGHALKLTVDMGYSFHEITSFWSSSGAGYLTDEDGQEGQFLLRTQLQLVF